MGQSDVICRSCFNLLNEIDRLDSKLSGAKYKICVNFNRTKASHSNAITRKHKKSMKNKSCSHILNTKDNMLLQNVDLKHNSKNRYDTHNKVNTSTCVITPQDVIETLFERPKVFNKSTCVVTLEDVKKQMEIDHQTSPENVTKLPSKPLITKEYCCPCCVSGTFCDDVKLIEHFKVAHNHVKHIRCLLCKVKLSKDIELYLSHLEEQHPGVYPHRKSQPSKECPECHQIMPITWLKRHLIQHVRIPCSICKVLLLSKSYKRHMTDCHTKETTYHCTDCSQVFREQYALRAHRRKVHLGPPDRPFICNKCGKRYENSYTHRRHIADVHDNIREHTCEFCGSSFKYAGVLKSHVRIHTGEMPYICKVCQKCFRHSTELKKHLKKIHNVEYNGRLNRRRKAKEKSTSVQDSESRKDITIKSQETNECAIDSPGFV